MSWNTFGRVLRFTTWGESHGPALGAVLDGCPPRITLSEEDVQPFMDARKPGQNRFTTQRKEADLVRILSGVFEGQTTGTPISLMIENTDQRSKDYSEIAKSYRPGHADYSYDAKYGIRDYRGGGRSSARETAARVAAGAVARLIIPEVKAATKSTATTSTLPKSATTRSSAPMQRPQNAGKRKSTPRARRVRHWARWSNAWPKVCPRDGVRLSMPNSTAIWQRR